MKSKSRILSLQSAFSQVDEYSNALGDLYDLAMVSRVDEALDLIPRWRPDLVLVDTECLDDAGMSFCRQLKKIPGARFAKLLFLSPRVTWEERLTGYGMGADGFLEAPLDQATLLSQVRLLLKLHDLESIDRLKTRLLHLLADPARTPLSGVTAPARLLTEDLDVDIEDRQRVANMVIEASDELQALVDRVVLLCEFRLGSVHLVREEFDLAALVREHATKVARQAVDGDAGMKIFVPDECPWVGSPHHLGMVAESIIDNALRYRTPGTMIEVSLNRTPAGARLSVTNYSEQLECEDVPRLFETAEGEESDLRRLGMSLPLVQDILREHGGTIELEVTERKMVRCLVELPRVQAPIRTLDPDRPAAGVSNPN